MSTPKPFKDTPATASGPGNSRTRRWGVLLAVLAVLISAPDGCLLRSIQVRCGAQNANLQIFALKFLMAAPMQIGWVLYDRGLACCWRGTCCCWQWVLLSMLFTVGAGVVTLANLESTSVSALLFFYVAPLWALIMGVFILRETLQTRTVVAVLVACAGVGLLFVPSWLHRHDPHPTLAGADAAKHAPSLWGDMLGLFSGICMAGYLTTCRHASKYAPDAPMVLGVAVGSLLSGVLGVMLVHQRGEAVFALPRATWPFLLMDALGIGCYGVLSALATQFLPGAEVAFLLLIDIILAPVLVMVIHGEVPSHFAGAGGLLLAVAVVGHEVASMREALRVAKVGLAAGHPPLKLRVSDANLQSLDGADSGSLGGLEEAVESNDESAGLLAKAGGSGLSSQAATPIKHVAWAAA